jgi:hypothetical protein
MFHNTLMPAIMALFLICNFSNAETTDTDLIRDTIIIFNQDVIHFTPDEPSKYDTENIFANDNGRIISTHVLLPQYNKQSKITACLAIHPIPKDEVSVYDPWDRAGNIRLSIKGQPDIEIIKFITSYGGFTDFTVDVSDLAPLLTDSCTFKGFIDTWLTPGWKIDFRLIYEFREDNNDPDWASPLVYADSYTEADMGNNGLTITIEIPDDIKRVKMHYFVSGHCTDGTDADEFISKDNIIYIDDCLVYRYKPWRDDCREFRDVNPYTRRWSDGYWSSDFSRSGWCPGDMVTPLELDLTDHLTPGTHTVRVVIEDVRPKDENGNYGYWRASGFLFGWNNK